MGAMLVTERFTGNCMSVGMMEAENTDAGLPADLFSRPMSLLKGTVAVLAGPPNTSWKDLNFPDWMLSSIAAAGSLGMLGW